jgi:beta-lactam-binding protein with PASTA domain
VDNPSGRDFCENCGEYLAWAPTSIVAAVPATGAAREQANQDSDEAREVASRAAHGPPGDQPGADRLAAPDPPEDGEPSPGNGAATVGEAAPVSGDLATPSAANGDVAERERAAAGDEDTGAAGAEAASAGAASAEAASAQAGPAAPVGDASGGAGEDRGTIEGMPRYVTADVSALHERTVRPDTEDETPSQPDPGRAPTEDLPASPGDAPSPGAPAPGADAEQPPAARRGPLPRRPALRRSSKRRGAAGPAAAGEVAADPFAPPSDVPDDGAGEAAAELPPDGEALFEDEFAGLPESPPPSGDASLVLLPADPAYTVGGVPAVDTNSTLFYRATIRNESQIVDNYDLAVLGLPENWAVVSPAAAFLVPLGAGRGESEMDLQIGITPPRDYRSTAGIWTFELVALSRTHGSVAARAIAQFEVRPFEAWSIEVVPSVGSGRFKSRYRTAVRNDGNAEQTLYPIAIDESTKLRTKFLQGQLDLDAGEVGADTLTLRPRFPKPVGRVTEHRIGVDVAATAPEVAEPELSAKEKLKAKAKEQAADAKGKAKDKAKGMVKVSATGVRFTKPRIPTVKSLMRKLKPTPAMLSRLRPGGSDAAAPLTARQVVFRQKPVIPLWFVGLLLLAALIALLLYLLLPHKTTVPVLEGQADSFVAEKLLRDKGLKLSQPVQHKEDPNSKSGTVIDQNPAAGEKVEEGTAVSIVVADSDTKVIVPRLATLTVAAADERLRKEGLQLGATEPPDAPDDYVVRSSVPDANLEVTRGTSVRVFLQKPPPSKAEKKAAAAKKAKAAAAASAAAKKKANDLKVPEFDAKKPFADYLKALDKLGLKGKVDTKPASKAAGLIISISPEAGKSVKKGDVVGVTASSGPPPLAVQTPSRILVLKTDGGKELFRMPGSAAEPSYYPNGDHVVYRAGSRIVEASTGSKPKPRTIYSGGDDLTRPTIAPDNETLAVIRREEGDGDLCFGSVQVPDLGQLCLPDDGWDLDGRISWSKDGKTVLVPGRRQANRSQFGVRAYTSKRPYARDPLLWSGKTATPTTTPGKGVLAAVFSPGGTKVAAISNLETDNFQVVFAPATDLALADATATGTAGCDVTWRPDGQELAAVQSDAGCSQPFGKIIRFSIAKPDKPAPVTARGRNPAYSTGN